MLRLKPEYAWVWEHAKAHFELTGQPYIVPPQWTEDCGKGPFLSEAARKVFNDAFTRDDIEAATALTEFE